MNFLETLESRLHNIECILLDIKHKTQAPPVGYPTTPDEEKPLNVGQAATFLDISEQTVYQNIKKIPHKKRFGRLYFFKSELLAYLNSGKGELN